MTIEKRISYLEGAEKEKFIADLKSRYERAKQSGFKGNIREFILKEKMQNILKKSEGLSKGGRPNGATTFTSDDWDIWLQQNDPNYMTLEEEEKLSKIKAPKKVAFKFGATSQSEEDLIGGHVDDWTNLINKGELDPSVDFMKYIDMILGRSGANRGGIVSVI